MWVIKTISLTDIFQSDLKKQKKDLIFFFFNFFGIYQQGGLWTTTGSLYFDQLGKRSLGK